MKKTLLCLPLVLAIAACSNDEHSSSDTPSDNSPTTIQELENTGAIPKLDRSDDVQGLDSDNNGIRDDIDEYVALHYSGTAQVDAANQAARANQSVLMADLQDPTSIRQSNQKLSRATACIYEVFGTSASSIEPAEVSRDLEAISFNTAGRLKKYMEFNKALDGASWSLPEGGSSCE